MLSLFKKYILPKEVDFFAYMREHSDAVNKIVLDLQSCFIDLDKKSCQNILDDESHSKDIKQRNMKELLGTFITPVDRESIYRVTTELDWVGISIRHFILEVKTYKIDDLKEYNPIFNSLMEISHTLNQGFLSLEKHDTNDVGKKCEEVREIYDKIVGEYIIFMHELSKSDDIKKIFVYKEILFQLRDISKRFCLCANSLEDIVAKMI